MDTSPTDAATPFRPPERFDAGPLYFRPLADDDCQPLFEQMLGDPDTMQDLAFARHTDAWQTHGYITEAMLGWRFASRFRYGLFGQDDGALCAIVELTPRLPQIELGVVISRRGGNRRRRDGIVALRKLLDWLIVQPGIYRVFACCAVDGRAHSAMERLGFVREATMINYEARPNRGLVAADSYLYALTRAVPQAGTPDTGDAAPQRGEATAGPTRRAPDECPAAASPS